jgi:predicted acyltransferase
MTTAQVDASSFVASDARANSPRLLSIDVFRGLMVAGMVLVTNPGTYDFIYWPLKHADWNGSTPTDMIFPAFLFIVGVSMTFSFASRRTHGETASAAALHILRRSAMLILLGLFLNCFDLLSLPHLRIPGVLQRIGLCYLCGGLLYLAICGKGSTRRVATLVAAIILLPAIYWALQTQVPVPGYGAGRLDQAGTFSAYIDRAVFTTKHLWAWGGPGQTWDPEGLLSTLPAIANLLLGILAGEWLRNLAPNATKRRVPGMAITGTLLMLAAIALNPLIPINKKIWTPSFMLLSGGFSLLAFALLHVLIDREDQADRPFWRRIATPAQVFGSNAILAFSLANVISPLLGLIHIHRADGAAIGVPGFFFEWFHQFFNPWNASLAYAVLFVLVNLAILWPLYQRRIFLRL